MNGEIIMTYIIAITTVGKLTINEPIKVSTTKDNGNITMIVTKTFLEKREKVGISFPSCAISILD
jgi:hypothetical protein